MKQAFLPDTNTFSRLLRRPTDDLKDNFRQHAPMIYLSAIVEAELRYGLQKKGLEHSEFGKLVHQLIDGFETLPWTSITAGAFADLRSKSEREGITLATADMMIAAQAMETGHVLVTNDQALHRLASWIKLADWTI